MVLVPAKSSPTGEIGFRHSFCEGVAIIRTDPERIIQEVGAQKLSETPEGRSVLENARAKYATELIQPGDSRFNAYYGKEVRQRERHMAELREESKRLKKEANFQ